MAFSDESCWLVVRGKRVEAVAAATGLDGFELCAARAGVAGARSSNAVFVCTHGADTYIVGAWVGDDADTHVRDLGEVLGARVERCAAPDTSAFGDGLAAPEPTLDLDSLFVRKDVSVRPAVAAREAAIGDFRATFAACARCGDTTPGRAEPRDGLPWEDFAWTFERACGKCGAKVEVQYPAGIADADEGDGEEEREDEGEDEGADEDAVVEEHLGYTDRWESWGYKTSWLAIDLVAPEAVMEALDLEGWQPCSWKAGVAGARAGLAVFVSPSVARTVFVLGDTIDEGDAAQRERRVGELSERLGTGVHLYVSQRVMGDYQVSIALSGTFIERARPADEDAVLALAARRGLDPRTLSSRPGIPPMGWAAPEPLPVGQRIRPSLSLLQRPAASRREARLHFEQCFDTCPECGERHFAKYPDGREALPWEPFAVAFTLSCPDCHNEQHIQYPAGPSYGHPPANDALRVSTSDAPSELFSTEQWRALLAQFQEMHEQIPSWQESPARERELFGKAALHIVYAAHELAKVGEHSLTKGELADFRARALR